jgi:hypothetical protein
VLRFSLALISQNSEKIISKDFEALIDFLKNGLFDIYSKDPSKFVLDASKIRISKAKLDAWGVDFLEKLRRESPDFLDAENLRIANRRIIGLND